MRIAVIGGSGFIGGHVVDKLVESGHSVSVIDKRSPHRLDVAFHRVDIENGPTVRSVLEESYDVVYMLAGIADVEQIHRCPSAALHTNICGLVNVLDSMRSCGGRLILASTVWVYGPPRDQWVAHEDAPLYLSETRHPYVASKIAAEGLVHSWHELYGLPFTILRYGIPYGPRSRDGTVIANFVARAMDRKPLIIHGDGSQSRCFVYVEDLASGNLAALDPAAIGRTYNLDGLRPVSIELIVNTIMELVGPIELEYRDPRPGDFVGRVTSTERARKELGWAPVTDLREGILRYIDWYRAALDQPGS